MRHYISCACVLVIMIAGQVAEASSVPATLWGYFSDFPLEHANYGFVPVDVPVGPQGGTIPLSGLSGLELGFDDSTVGPPYSFNGSSPFEFRLIFSGNGMNYSNIDLKGTISGFMNAYYDPGASPSGNVIDYTFSGSASSATVSSLGPLNLPPSILDLLDHPDRFQVTATSFDGGNYLRDFFDVTLTIAPESPTPVPEPGSLLIGGLVVGACAAYRVRSFAARGDRL